MKQYYHCMKTVFKNNRIILSLAAAFVLCVTPFTADAQIVEPGFEQTTIASGFTLPTALAFAPDGRIFVAEKGGTVRVIKNGAVLPTPLITLSDVNTFVDRGLIGIAVDPNFDVNGYLYLAYTYENSPGFNFGGAKTGRISRVTVVGDVASESSKVVILGTEGGNASNPSCDDFAVTVDCIPSDSPSHSVGGLRFGPDGKLYATLGDGADFATVDPKSYRAQDIDSLAGKTVRINTDGTAPSDNPFYNGDPNANRSKVFSYGHRNQFRLNFHPTTGRLYGGDVMWGGIEEVNRLIPGANYGWPCYEANLPVPGYTCPASGMMLPTYQYDHDASGAGSITVGAFGTNGVYPASYDNTMIIGDYAQNWLKLLELDDDHNVVEVRDFLGGAVYPVDISTGIDGNIYYIDIAFGAVNRITHTTGNRTPVPQVDATPTSGLAPLAVNFTSAGSLDPDGDPLTYFWDFGDGNTSTSTDPSHTYTTNGQFDATLTLTDDQGSSAAKSITITVGNQAPQPIIQSPASGSLYTPLQLIQLTATATDPEDGTLPASAFDWEVILHHNTHVHYVQNFTGVQNPSFIADEHNDPDVYMEVILTVTDSGGLESTQSINLYVNNGVGSGNLVVNPSVEIEDETTGLPASWSTGWFGNLFPTFDYPEPGLAGTSSVKVTVQNYVDGDAKWVFSPVSVTPGETYSYSNKYISNTTTSHIVEYTYGNGTQSYELLGDVPPTATPVQVDHSITVPVNVQTMAVFHRLISNGELTIDDIVLTLDTSASGTPPTAVITAPADGSTVSGAVTVDVDATDDIGVVDVRLLVDGSDTGLVDTTAPYSFTWNSGTVADGAHTLIARSLDTDGNFTASTPISVTVDNSGTSTDTTPPTVSVTDPVESATVSGTSTLIQVNATDNVAVTEVRLLIDGAETGAVDTTAPYTFDWDTTSVLDGAHTISARAFDAAGNQADATNINVLVDNVAAPTNLIYNGDMEIANGAAPDGWNIGSWGTHQRVMTYPVLGRGDTGSAVKTEITVYDITDTGDSKWFFDEVPVTPGTEYVFEDYFKSDTISDVIGQYRLDDDSFAYFGLEKEIQPAADWTLVNATFTPPVNATHVTFLHLISSVGELTVDDAALYVNGTSTPSEIIPPVVEFISPLDGDTVSGTITLQASSSDNVGVTYVLFAVDGTPFGGQITTPPYEVVLDTTTLTNGTHTLKATTHDAAGNNAAEIITVTVDNQVATGTNLIANPSLEDETLGDPTNWQSNGWGTNTHTFTYPVAGIDGADAARVEMTSYTSGDAKWFFDAVPVVGGETYTFSNQYRSDVTTFPVIRYTLDDTSVQYVGLDALASTGGSWATNTENFTAPANAVEGTLFHVIADVGFLEVDDYSLTGAAAGPGPNAFDNGKVTFAFDDGWVSHYTDALPTLDAAGYDGTFYIVSSETLGATSSPELVANPSLEDDTAGIPDNWQTSNWGVNTPTFTYPVAGIDGADAARVEISSYTSGDAKWYFDDVPVTVTDPYTIEYQYRSDVESQAIVRYTLDDSSFVYDGLGVLPSSGGSWAIESKIVIIPANAVSMTVMPIIADVGFLEVDNFSVKRNQIYVTPAEVLAIEASGHEIGGHTKTHVDLTTVSAGVMADEIAGSQTDILGMGVTSVTTFAYPYGAYNASVQAETSLHYIAGRGTDDGFNLKNTDKYALLVKQVDRTTTITDIQDWVTEADQNQEWLILMFHQINDDLTKTLGITPSFLTDIVNYVGTTDVDVITVEEGVGLMD